MKVKTNLSNRELEKVAKGLEALAQHASDGFVAQNDAEEHLFGELDRNYDRMKKSLLRDVSKIAKE